MRRANPLLQRDRLPTPKAWKVSMTQEKSHKQTLIKSTELKNKKMRISTP